MSQCTGDMDNMGGVFGNAGLIIHSVTDIVVVKLLSILQSASEQHSHGVNDHLDFN